MIFLAHIEFNYENQIVILYKYICTIICACLKLLLNYIDFIKKLYTSDFFYD